MDEIGHCIPYRLRFFQIRARFLWTFGTATKSPGLAATPCATVAAGIKHFCFGSETASAGNMLDSLVQPIDSMPCLYCAPLMLNPLIRPKISRAFRTKHPTRGHHAILSFLWSIVIARRCSSAETIPSCRGWDCFAALAMTVLRGP